MKAQPENKINPTVKAPVFINKYIFLIIGVFGGFIFGFFISKLDSSPSPELKEERLQKQYKFTNPLLECNSDIGSYKLPNKIKNKVDIYINNQISVGNVTNVAVYYRDLNNGPWFGINEHMLFTPASLIKVPIMITYFKKAESDPNLLSQKLQVETDVSNVISDTNIKPQVTLDANKEYTIEELIEHMIIYSDNDAYKTLKDYLSTYEFNEIFNDFGIDIAAIENSSNENVFSIIDYSSFFRILYNSSYLSHDFSEKALEILSRSDYKDGIVAGIPQNTPVAHKFGERFYDETSEKQLHDCGIVYKVNSPYLVCIMTRGKDFSKLSQSIREISNIVYSSLE